MGEVGEVIRLEREDKETGFSSESEDEDAEGGSKRLSDGDWDSDAENVVRGSHVQPGISRSRRCTRRKPSTPGSSPSFCPIRRRIARAIPPS